MGPGQVSEVMYLDLHGDHVACPGTVALTVASFLDSHLDGRSSSAS